MKKFLLAAVVFIGMTSFAMAQDHHRPTVHHKPVHHSHHVVHHHPAQHHPVHHNDHH